MIARNWLFCFQISLAFVLILMLVFPPIIGHCTDEKVWYVHDIINPSLDHIYWSEDGRNFEVPYVSDGEWYQASMSQSLIDSNDIFVSTYDQFNWSLVRPNAEKYFGVQFNSFSAFQIWVTQNPSPWLQMSWKIDTSWWGVSFNTTKVVVSFDETTQTVELSTWFHITRVPEYLAGSALAGNFQNWLTGFDLTPVSTGSLDLWEFHEVVNINGTHYNLRFEAPADVLTQHGDIYNCSIPVNHNYWGQPINYQQAIDINMPADTEAKAATYEGVLKGNTATFYIYPGDSYPSQYSITSGPPAKSVSQAFWEDASVWLLAPGGWATIGSLIVLSFTGLRGRRIWQRNKLYHRIYKSMVTIYDMYSQDSAKFHREMDNVSRSSIKMLIDDRITDEQFEKLLKRRDDLIERSEKQGIQTSTEP